MIKIVNFITPFQKMVQEEIKPLKSMFKFVEVFDNEIGGFTSISFGNTKEETEIICLDNYDFKNSQLRIKGIIEILRGE